MGFEPGDAYVPEEPKTLPPAWMDGTYRIGIHTSIAGHVAEALELASGLGANALQIFSASPRMWAVDDKGVGRSRFTPAEASQFRARREELKLGPLVIHANYLINLASPERVLRARSVQAFHDEIVRARALDADYLVVHPGAGRGSEGARAVAAVAESLHQAARGVSLGRLRLLLENTAGQGTALGATFSELKAILALCADLPMGVCVDTAHLYAAGFDISTAEGLEKTLLAIEATVGLAQVYVVHVNDSKAPLGSRVDRHQHIGKGRIGREALRRLVTHPLLAPPSPDQPRPGTMTRAFILETPIDRPGDDARNVRELWALAGRPLEPRARANRDGFVRRGKKSKSRKGGKAAGKRFHRSRKTTTVRAVMRRAKSKR